MKRIFVLILPLAFISIFFLGCQSQEETYSLNNNIKFDGEIVKISISKIKGNNDYVFADKDSIEFLRGIALNAVKENRIVNMSNPNFYIDIEYKNKKTESLYLWLGGESEKSALMKMDDNSHTIYTISEEMSSKFSTLLKK
ncbi:hypothetical protein [Niallia circulans]|jgi:hypothetical protein|uniref:hypothetical protein n=1 Tax=Niallia circulans TaxID=1397 RepID=UPI0011A4B104